MKTIAHELFTLDIPNFLEERDRSSVGVWTDDREGVHKNQWPTLDVVVLPLADLESDTYEGDDWISKFEDSCLSRYFRSEKLYGEHKRIQGFDAYVMEAHTDTSFQKTLYMINYLFVCIRLDERFYLQFAAVHEKNASAKLENWVLDAFGSLQVLGSVHDRGQAWDAHIKITEAMAHDNTPISDVVTEITSIKTTYSPKIPEDGKAIFQVGDFYFDIVEDEGTAMYISDFSNELTVKIAAKTNAVTKAVKAQLLDDYPGDGVVTIEINAKGIHQEGIPTGELHFEEGKTNAPLFLYSRIKGFDYRLDFNGTVKFEAGWLLLEGQMTKSYHNKSFPITVCKKFDLFRLQWKDYRFTSLSETVTAKPEEVRFLSIENPAFLSLPEVIFNFVNLKELRVFLKSNLWDGKKLPLQEISEKIGGLKQLTHLQISGCAIAALPESLGTLKELQHLSVNNCALQLVPKGVWQLPNLKFIWLESNQLAHIPETIDLPGLAHISLKENQLKTLPATLADQPQLKKVNLDKNPLEILPQNFNKIQTIELTMEDKLRLLDFEYHGADGSGLVAWNDQAFYALDDQDLMQQVQNVITNNKLQEYQNALSSLVKKSIGFCHVAEEDYTIIGNHRFGGLPDLPLNVPYPRFGENWSAQKKDYVYEFIGQINCGDIAQVQSYLPRKGMLFFFLETLHNVDGGQSNPGLVIYVEDSESLASGSRFAFDSEDYFEMVDDAYQGFKVSAKKMNSVPSFYASYTNKHLFLGEAAMLAEDDELLEELYDVFEDPINKKNHCDYAMNAYGFSQHEHPELQAALVKKGRPQDWITLLKVTSSGDMQWNDAGELFFVIHKSDLAKKDFSNVFVTLESS